ncbi:MAG TPA: transaldolase family protein [Armatimonadota bacterium]|jgi:transaldolase
MNDAAVEILQDLILRTPSADFAARQQSWREELAAEYPAAAAERQDEIAELLAENAIDLRSVLADWRLKCWKNHPHSDSCVVLREPELAAMSAANLALLHEWGRTDEALAAEAEITSLAESNLVRLTRMSFAGQTNVYWGNDYAAHLRPAMRRGAALVTTNPVLVNVARKEDPAHWTAVRDALRAKYPNYSPVELGYALTIQVVVANAKLLRPIWELTNEQYGYVSLQLSPECATDAEKMIAEATWVWEQLTAELGGKPNTVFKVPGTKAGLEVAAALTSRGIGVNVTVMFALAQQIAFAAVIEKNSTAPVSFRTQMDGRLDDPVGDEMQAAGVSDWEEVKKWCTTAIRQREYRLLSKDPLAGGLGCFKSYPLPAAGRGVWNILRSIHNEPEVPLYITIFPDRQAQFDEEPREIDPQGMWAPLPAGYLDKLNQSQLFRQAFEPDGLRPEEFESFLPSERTLAQFCASYREYLDWVAE